MLVMKSGSAVTVTVRPDDEGRVTPIFVDRGLTWTRTVGHVGSAAGLVEVVVLRATILQLRGTAPLVKALQVLQPEVWMLLDRAEVSL